MAWYVKGCLIQPAVPMLYGRGLAGTIAESREPLLVPIVNEDSTDSRRTLARGRYDFRDVATDRTSGR